jgi:excisionase family DNA binding protein
MDSEVLDVEGAAALLGVGSWTIREQARAGRLPGRKVGTEWRFSRRILAARAAGSSPEEAEQMIDAAIAVRRSSRR